MKTTTLAASFLALAAGSLAAQAPDSDPRARLLEEWERYRANVVAYVEVVPDSVLHFKPTPLVRNYAEQIEHIVLDNVVIVATGVEGRTTPPDLGDKAAYLQSRSELRRFVDAGFDYVASAIRRLDPATLQDPVSLFGEAEVTRGGAFRVALEHGAWTLGQVVPYLRMNGITPPDYRLLP